MNWYVVRGERAFEVELPASVCSLCEGWAQALGCTYADCMRSLLSCGLAYVLTLDKGRDIGPLAAKALSDLAGMAPQNGPVDWYTIDLETGQIGQADQ